MNYNEFKEMMKDGVKAALGDVKISFREIRKANESYQAMTVTPNDSNIGANINLEAFHKMLEDGMCYSNVLAKVVAAIENGLENIPAFNVPSLTDYEKMKDKLVVELISTKTNEELLSNVPHQEMEDMSLVYRFVLDSSEDSRSSILVTNQLLESMEVSPEKLHADAMENAPKLKPAVIRGMSEVMAEMMGKSVEELAVMGMPVPEEEQMYVATVPDMIHGAGILAYQDFMNQAAERAGGDFFILPSSIHEVLIVPDNGNVTSEDLIGMVKDVNETQVAPNERLTDSVYHYSVSEATFEKVA